MGLCKVEKGRTYSLKDFSEAQFSQLQEVSPSQVSQHVCFTYSDDGHAILFTFATIFI